jgi:putative redox protein
MRAEARVAWVGPGLRLVATGSQGPGIVIDHAPPGEERAEAGPRPMELLLIGLGSCTAMDVVSILQKKRQSFSGVDVEITAERAEDHPMIYTEIHLQYVVHGRGVEAAAVERAIELSQTKYCGATAMLGKAASISTSFRIVED